MNKKVAFFSLSVLFIAALFIWTYNLVQADHWREQNAAVKRAVSVGDAVYGLQKVDDTDWFNGDKSYTIIFGRDADNRRIIAWVSDTDVHMEYADEGISRKQAENLVKAETPKAVIIRAVPGVLNDTYVWEVYYKANIEGATKYFYAYYRFADGKRLDKLYLNS
ncbi:MAG TPA: DUF5590 domain-containing protein [Bacilli bacterium]